MGKAALEGLPGVKKVTSGWHRYKEINTVDYDPMQISPEEMVAELERAGTYIGTVRKENTP